MGYKIEIVLISIAVLLCGAIVLFISVAPNTPTAVVVNEITTIESNIKFTTSKEVEINETVESTNDVQGNKININTATIYQI